MKKAYYILISLLFLQIHAPLVAQNKARLEFEKKDYREALTTVGALYSNIQRYFIDTVQLSKINNVALNAMLIRLDPYTQYMDKKTAKSFMEATDGAYAGIGAIISQRAEGKVFVNELLEGQPADKAGLKPGDQFLSINGKDFSQSSSPKVSTALRGLEGSDITIIVKRKNVEKPLSFHFKRKNIVISSVAYAERLAGDIGIIRISSFTKETAKDVKKELTSLLKGGALKGLILDLRDNGGGVLQSAVEMLSYFLPKGTTVVTVRGRISESNADYKTVNNPIAPTIPLVVLINDDSASASEIVAGALQDTDRAVIMGHKSFGKGLVQSTIALPGEALLKLTTAQYFIPSGRNIQKITYSHFNESDEENENKSEKVDSTKVKFYTKGGRPVLGGEGIRPDIETKIDTIPAIVSFIAIDTLFLDYIEHYVATHTPPSSPRAIHLTDHDYQEFIKYLSEGKFQYKAGSSYLLDKIEEQLKMEGKKQYLDNELKQLRQAINPPLRIELQRHEKEIRAYIEEALALRYFYRKGFYTLLIPRDKEVQQALSLLGDSKRYQTTLSVRK